MRKRRAILFDDEPLVLLMLERFLKRRGYEVHSFTEPLVCPVFMNNEHHCLSEKPCADVVISDYHMPVMSGIELFERQKERGCNLDIRNKAIISGNLNGDAVEARLEELGCAFFSKPFQLDVLSNWLLECEARMPLTTPLAYPRREKRAETNLQVDFSIPSLGRRLSGMVVNMSRSGFCIASGHALSRDEMIVVETALPLASNQASVRWCGPLDSTTWLAGASCC